MKRKEAFIIFLFLLTGGLIFSCINKDDKDEMPCLCFKNNSSSYVSGVRYRLTGTTAWTYSIFDENVSTGGDGFSCEEGTFDIKIPAGSYDFEVLNTSSSSLRGWEDVPYDGGNIGFLVTNSTSGSLYGSVDSNCNQTGTAYSADY